MDFNINIENFRIYHVSGTSSVVIGTGAFNKQSSQTKTNNGVGNAYGDHSEIDMSPTDPILNDSDAYDSLSYTENEKKKSKETKLMEEKSKEMEMEQMEKDLEVYNPFLNKPNQQHFETSKDMTSPNND